MRGAGWKTNLTFSSPGLGFSEEKVCSVGSRNERLLRDISAELPVPFIAQKAAGCWMTQGLW